jgi:23S rRNA (uracil1939-C5)-methyltransferase
MTCKRTARRPPRTVDITIDTLAFGGDAVGRDADGRVTFVGEAAPGDRVRVRLTEEHKGWARGELDRLLEAGQARQAPPCPLAVPQGDRPACGGCQWQQVTIAAQAAAKADIVRRALRHVTAEVAPLVEPCPPLGWRRRARLRARLGRLGFAARRSHALVDVASCPQLDAACNAALATIRQIVRLGDGDEVQLLAGRGVHVAFSAGVDRERARALCGQGGIVGVRVGEASFGEPRVDLGDDDRPFWGRADLFAQASAAGNAALREHLRGELGRLDGLAVLELHAGSGNFSRDLLAAGARLTAVEEVAAAAALARDNLAGRGEVRFLAQTAAQALAQTAAHDLLLLDPPRVGLAADEVELISAPRVVYVSCDPETLARDLGRLLARGYRVTRAVPFDLMPQTSHVEIIVHLTR